MAKTRQLVASAAAGAIRLAQIWNEEQEEAQAKVRADRNEDFVQFPRIAMDAFVGLVGKSPAAAQVLLLMARAMVRSNVVALPSKAACDALGISRATYSRAIALLKADAWITPADHGGPATFRVNAMAFWSTGRTFKAGKDVFRAALPITRTPTGEGLGEALKPVLVPVIARRNPGRHGKKGPQQ